MTVTSLFWDFDGTLFDTYPLMVTAFERGLTNLGVDAIELDEQDIYETMRQHSLGTALQRFSAMFGLQQPKLEAQYRKIEPTLIDQAQPFDGVAELLKHHLVNGGRHFLLTHRDDSALRLLESAGMLSAFTGMVTSKTPFPRKPNPASLNALIERYSVDRQGAVMIGDRTLDIEAGHNAGIQGALFDPGRLIDAKKSHPEYVASQMAELEKQLFS